VSNLSESLDPITLDSESPEKGVSRGHEQRSPIAGIASTTISEDLLQSQTRVAAEACGLARGQLRERFVAEFLQLIHEGEFEFGFSTPADRHVRSALEAYGTFAREWISEVFVNNFDKPFVSCAVLRVIAHFDYRQVQPMGLVVALSATVHKDAEVQECGVRCFESWQAPECLNVLKTLSFSEGWLSDYLAGVISDLEGLDENGDPS